MLAKIVIASVIAPVAVLGLTAATSPTQTQEKPAAQTASAATKSYGVDDVHSSAMFRVHHAGAGQFWGRINDVSGTFTLSDDAAKTAFNIEVAVDSVDTGEPKLDGHLKSPDFFNSKEFPKLAFKSTSAKKGPNGAIEVTGELTMHGVTKPVTAMIEVTGQADMGMGARGGAEATFTVKRSEFGMNYGVEKGMIGDSVKVVVNLEGVQTKS